MEAATNSCGAHAGLRKMTNQPEQTTLRTFHCSHCKSRMGLYTNDALQIDQVMFHKVVTVTCLKCGTKNCWRPTRSRRGTA